MPDDDADYGMVLPFVTVSSKGGPHEDQAYTAGWEMGRLDADLIFGCCDHFEHENALDDALASAYSLDNSDYHAFVCIECPDGTVIDDQSPVYREYEVTRRTRAAEQRTSTPTIYGRVEVRGPSGDYWRREYTYSEAEHQKLAQKYTEWYGPDRVRTDR